ncbi:MULTISPECIES: CBO0543 family protein [Clostridia]|uniref:CBO0543 family protein n=1 Tax=Clostridia TaxID=186801 RepID=UPI000EA232E2|nr:MULTISPECIES: CBO0543 family protein [Clostridia]NBJ69399.1 hypothetical protein [Roseburia sp. 1XD42-34]RKI78796.1 hypothetical protein D7V87_07945 [Clostridium sp. 1xD42-85]
MTVREGLEQTERASLILIEVNQMITDALLHAFLFTWQWWLGVILFILPWTLWILFRNKNSTGRLLGCAFLTIALSLLIDLISLSYGLWSYPMKFSPVSPILFLPYHLALAPVAIMFVLQIKPKANPLLKGSIFAAIAAFGGMNGFNALDFYNPKNWSIFYDFFIFLFLFFSSYWLFHMQGYEKIVTEEKVH